MKRDNCGLCKKNAPLQKSHLLPAAVFKMLRSPESDMPDPIHTSGGVSRTTSTQPKTHFLCADCEQRFNRNGENEVLRLCARTEESFPLKEKLLVSEPFFQSEEFDYAVYDCSELEGISWEAFTYFAASVIWRSSAGVWKWDGRRLIPTSLGPYEEPFRKYLLGESKLPEEAALCVTCAKEGANWGSTFMPQTLRKGDQLRPHVFRIPGITFELFVSGRNPLGVIGSSINLGQQKTLIFKKFEGTSLDRSAMHEIDRSEERGKLKRIIEERGLG